MPAPKVYRNRQPEPQVEVEAVPNEHSTNKAIKEYLDAKGIEYTSRMTKDDLLELL